MYTQFEQKICQTTCPYCGVGCGVDVTVKNDQVVSVAGSETHPANFGKLCVKGSNLAETVGLEGRLLSPVINDQTASWQQATDLVAQQFQSTIKQFGPDSVAFYVSGQILTEDYYVANKLMKGFIGSGNIDTNSRLCMSSAVAGYKRAFGADIVPCSYKDLTHTELLVLVGSNAAWTHPILFQQVEKAKQQNPDLKIVVIDPRRTATAELADLFLPIKAGSDVALFNGLLQFLIEQKQVDNTYIKQHCDNWNEAMQSVADCSLNETAKQCGLEQAELKQFYQYFAQSPSAVTFYSQGVNQSSQGVDKCNAIINCHLATGKIGKLGSGPFSITGQPNAMGGREVGGLANMLAAHMNIENVEHRELVQDFWQSPTMTETAGAKAVDMFDKLKNGDIKAIWIMATNPMVSLPNRNQVEAALKACPFVVVSDCMDSNDTMMYADVKLPATTWSEKDGTVTNSERRISRQRGVVSPPGETKHDWQIICDVAKKMGFASGFDYQHPYQIFKEHAQLSGVKNGVNGYPVRDFDISAFSQITKRQYEQFKPIQWPVNDSYPNGCSQIFSDGRFYTKTGNAQFIAVNAAKAKQQPNNEFPFVLNSGRVRDHWHTMTRTGKSPSLGKHVTEPMLSMHPNDAGKLGLQKNHFVQVTSPQGQVTLLVHLDEGCQLGNVFAPIHWSQMTAASANVANCYSSHVDPISGQPESKFAIVNLKQVTFRQYQQIFSRSTLNVQTEYWVKNVIQYGVEYRCASDEVISDSVTWGKTLTGIEGNWHYFDDAKTGVKTLVCISNGQLEFVSFLSHQRLDINSDWIDSLLSLTELNTAQLSMLLTANVVPEFANGKLICSCFKVGENQIIQAITEQNDDSVEKLGERLKCGTNCGSCKSELKSLLKQHISHQTIAITQIEPETIQ